ncbi:glycosyltransferase [Candidatus Micrarchaeota archaeon]|nr:glycosyltransferase [Candidatus Micrarchaeota archaeon]
MRFDNILLLSFIAIITIIAVGFSGWWIVYSIMQQSWFELVHAIVFFLLMIGTSFFTVIGGIYSWECGRNQLKPKPPTKFSPVAVVVPTYKVNPEIVKETLESIKKIEYPGEMNIYLLDDGKNKVLKEFCKKNGIGYFTRNNREGFKGGAINEFLKTAKEEYLAIFDADEKVTNFNFLMDTMGHFENEKVAFIQTDKGFRKGDLFQDAATITDTGFFNLVQPVNTRYGISLFSGSCGILRIKDLKAIGGFPRALIEDVSSSFRLRLREKIGLHMQISYAKGKPYERFSEFTKSHSRYMYGITELIPIYMRRFPLFGVFENILMGTVMYGLHYLSVVQLLFALVILSILVQGYQVGMVAALLYFIQHITFLVLLSYIFSKSLTRSFLAYLLNFSLLFPRLYSGLKSALKIKMHYYPRITRTERVLSVVSALVYLPFIQQGPVSTIIGLWMSFLFISYMLFKFWKN